MGRIITSMIKNYKKQIYLDKKSEWRWRIICSNGHMVLGSTISYKNEHACQDQVNQILSGKDYYIIEIIECEKFIANIKCFEGTIVAKTEGFSLRKECCESLTKLLGSAYRIR